MPISCPQCGAQMPDQAAFCPGCGLRIFVATPGVATTSGFQDKFFGALAYVTFIPAIIFLLNERFRHNRFVRFHSLQSILLAVAGVLAAIALRLLLALFSLIPRLGYLVGWLVIVVVCIGWLILWIVLLIKALQGEMFKLPLIGDWAEGA